MRKKYIRILTLICLLLFSFGLSGCEKNKSYDIHTEAQKNYLAGDYTLISSYADGEEELSKPKAIVITWEEKDDFSNYTFYLSEDENFNTYRKYITYSASVELINLKINTTYYWYVENVSNNKIQSFVIETSAPRNLDVDGLTNVRDVGGYKIGNDKYSNQGLIYRSSRLNENETKDLLITDSGIKEMLEVLGVKSELDIRRTDNNENGGITSSPLGSEVNYFSVPMNSGGNCIILNKEVLKDAFSVLGDKDNYPIVIHCSIGTDRTGMLCFLINALLGVSEEDLYRDYLFSNFGNIGRSRSFSIIGKYIDTVKLASGKTLAERTFNYLLSLGVSEVDLNNLIKIMTE